LCCNGLRGFHVFRICGLVVVWSLFIVQHPHHTDEGISLIVLQGNDKAPLDYVPGGLYYIRYGLSHSSYSGHSTTYANNRKSIEQTPREYTGMFFKGRLRRA